MQQDLKELEMNNNSKEELIKIAGDTTLNNTSKWTTKIKGNLLMLQQRDLNPQQLSS